MLYCDEGQPPRFCPQAYDDEHDKEAALFDHLGRLLAEVKAFARYRCAGFHNGASSSTAVLQLPI